MAITTSFFSECIVVPVQSLSEKVAETSYLSSHVIQLLHFRVDAQVLFKLTIRQN